MKTDIILWYPSVSRDIWNTIYYEIFITEQYREEIKQWCSENLTHAYATNYSASVMHIFNELDMVALRLRWE
jgi:hypothetical protein